MLIQLYMSHCILLSLKELKTKTVIVRWDDLYRGNIINNELLRVAYLLSDLFPNSSPTLFFFFFLDCLENAFWLGLASGRSWWEIRGQDVLHLLELERLIWQWLCLIMVIGSAGLALHNCLAGILALASQFGFWGWSPHLLLFQSI